MKFSLIVPVRNRAHVVERTLSSMLAQTHRPLQLILVDNNSSDGSLDILHDFASKHNSPDFEVVVTSEVHQTAGAARNAGLNLATADWVVFFDSDDTMSPTLVEQYASIVEANDCDIVVTRGVRLNADGTTRPMPHHTTDLIANHLLHCILPTQLYTVRKDFFNSTDGWNINLPQWNDFEMGLRLLLARPRITFMPTTEPMVQVYDSGKASITGTEFGSRRGAWEQVLDIMGDEIRCSKLPDKQRLLRLVEYRKLVLAALYEREGIDKDTARHQRDTAIERMEVSWAKRLAMKFLYRHIANGRRGAARIAIKII